MKREVNTKFFTFDQNNSGGYFITNDEFGISEYVIIEALDLEHAWNKLENFEKNIPNMFDSCPCCGERWSMWCDEDGADEPMIYSKKLEDIKPTLGYRDSSAFVHYFDGTFKKFEFK